MTSAPTASTRPERPPETAVIRLLGVVVPARDEEDRIRPCLDALRASRRRLARAESGPGGVAVRIVVVLDSCVDRTGAAARSYPGVETVGCDAGRVGAARDAGVAHLLGTAAVPAAQTWLASTDADSTVPADWMTGMVEDARRGAHLVLGTVLPGPGLAPATEAAWRKRHPSRDDHPHVHGANFGIRADSYRALGGWPPTDSGEDVALAQRAAADGELTIVRTGRYPVRTSTRLAGRAPRGFSSYLRGLGATTDHQPATDRHPARSLHAHPTR